LISKTLEAYGVTKGFSNCGLPEFRWEEVLCENVIFKHNLIV